LHVQNKQVMAERKLETRIIETAKFRPTPNSSALPAGTI